MMATAPNPDPAAKAAGATFGRGGPAPWEPFVGSGRLAGRRRDLHEYGAGFDTLALFGLDRGHATGDATEELVLHLHRFDDHEDRALLHPVTQRDPDVNHAAGLGRPKQPDAILEVGFLVFVGPGAALPGPGRGDGIGHAADDHIDPVPRVPGQHVECTTVDGERKPRRRTQPAYFEAAPAVAEVDSQGTGVVFDFGFDFAVAELQKVLRQKPPPGCLMAAIRPAARQLLPSCAVPLTPAPDSGIPVL